MIARRGLLAGLGALLAAPAIIRTHGLLMPVKNGTKIHPEISSALVEMAKMSRQADDDFLSIMRSYERLRSGSTIEAVAARVDWRPLARFQP